MATEKRLIDANEAYEIARTSAYYSCFGCSLADLTDLEELLEDCDTVDAVEVVRCKDCKHWYEPEGVCLKIYSDGAVSPYAWQYRNADDFCSYGERKDNEVQG